MEAPLAIERFFEGRARPVFLAGPDPPYEPGEVEEAMARHGLEHHLAFASSGTSGPPKVVCHSREGIWAQADRVNRHLRIEAASVLLRCLPWWHVGGFSLHARAVRAGARLVEEDSKWAPARLAALLSQEGVTHLSLVPTQVFDLVAERIPAPASLQAVVVGGGALLPEWGERAQALGWPLLGSYGMTETGSQVATQSPGESFAPEPLPLLEGWSARVDQGGRLLLSGGGLCSGWLRKENDTWRWEEVSSELPTSDEAEVFTREGQSWLRSLRRGDEVVKILGELVSLSAVEERLGRSDVLVLAVPEERAGARLVLVGEGLTVEELERVRASWNGAASGLERLSSVHALERFPRSDLGKVRRALVLRELTS
ncbi:MAG: AMP-binding protein [Verrucomicrobiota bacterium]